MKKIFLISAGCTSLSLGVIGIFVPVLPTTPFLLLASACFIRSSDRLYSWLINHRFLGVYIRNYLLYGAITRKAKIISVSLLWVFIGFSAFYVAEALWLKILLIVIACGVTIHILRLRTFTGETAGQKPQSQKKQAPE